MPNRIFVSKSSFFYFISHFGRWRCQIASLSPHPYFISYFGRQRSFLSPNPHSFILFLILEDRDAKSHLCLQISILFFYFSVWETRISNRILISKSSFLYFIFYFQRQGCQIARPANELRLLGAQYQFRVLNRYRSGF